MIVDEFNLLDLTVFAKETLQCVFSYLKEEVANVKDISMRIPVDKVCRRDASAQPGQVDPSRYAGVHTAWGFLRVGELSCSCSLTCDFGCSVCSSRNLWRSFLWSSLGSLCLDHRL